MNNDLKKLTTEELGQKITELSSQLNAGTYQRLLFIAEFDSRQAFNEYGMKSTASWLNWQVGIALGAAREKVRVARALKSLPAICESMQTGQLSYSKVRAITRVATSETEHDLLDIAHQGTAAHVEKTVRLLKGVNRIQETQQANDDLQARYANCIIDDDGMVVLSARLPADLGAVVKKALEIETQKILDELKNAQAPDAQVPHGARNENRTDIENKTETETETETENKNDDGNADLDISYTQAMADALGRLAEAGLQLAAGPRNCADRYQVVVHTDLAVLAGAKGRCGEEGGIDVSAQTSRRLACHASLVEVEHDPQSYEPLNIGRKSRKPSAAILRALHSRDGGCRFTGCNATRFVDAHHIKHWADGGETNLDNLVLLCPFHHKAVHEGGFTVERTTNGHLVFRSPDGTAQNKVGKMPLSSGFHSSLDAPWLDNVVDTPPNRWGGESMDYDWALQHLLAPPEVIPTHQSALS